MAERSRSFLAGLRSAGVPAALIAALLFGVSTPLAKQLLTAISPWLLAGLLYLGSGVALTTYRLFRPSERPRLSKSELGYLIGAIGAGGIAAPVLLMSGLASMPASDASLLLNAEGVLTALLGWLAFRENVDRRVAIGMVIIALGAVLLSWSPGAKVEATQSGLFVIAACLAWAVDNNLTRKIALLEPTWLAAIKGLAAGTVNLIIAVILGAKWPGASHVIGALGVGALAYGLSLTLFIVGLRHLGAARTAAYFSIAPFVGALVAVIGLNEPVTWQLLAAGTLMAIGVWLHLTEQHEHTHHHTALEHEHEHVHDEHHQHEHSPDMTAGSRHTHRHRHAPMTHFHHHFPDSHHQHDHDR